MASRKTPTASLLTASRRIPMGRRNIRINRRSTLTANRTTGSRPCVLMSLRYFL